jgi:hypothetical protein
MTRQKVKEAVAELDGWKPYTHTGTDGENYGEPFSENGWKKGNRFEFELPDYFSRDAIVDVIKKQDPAIIEKVKNELYNIWFNSRRRPKEYSIDNFSIWLITVPVPILREALLKATERWKA